MDTSISSLMAANNKHFTQKFTTFVLPHQRKFKSSIRFIDNIVHPRDFEQKKKNKKKKQKKNKKKQNKTKQNKTKKLKSTKLSKKTIAFKTQ